MIRILLACEGGTGVGHVDSLLMFRKALGDAFSFDGVHYSDEALDLMRPHCDDVFTGTFTGSGAGAKRRGAVSKDDWSWSDFLEQCGFAKPAELARKIVWWRGLLRARRIDLAICDYAPTALLAARSLGVRTVLTGTAHSVPPRGLRRFPSYMNPRTATNADEEGMLAAVNAVCGIRGIPRLEALPEIYDCDVRMPQGLDVLDPYRALRTEPLLPRPNAIGTGAVGDGDEIFVYLSNPKADPDFLFEALGDLGAPVRAYIPWLPTERIEALRRAGVMLEDGLLQPDSIARRTRLMILYGQPGTAALGMALGIPQVHLPQHLEQRLHAGLAAAQGGVAALDRDGLDRAAFAAAVRAAYADEALLSAARRNMPAARRQLSTDAGDFIREALREPLVRIIRERGLA